MEGIANEDKIKQAPSGQPRHSPAEGDSALSRRLFALGFVPGTELFCERLSPFGSPMLVSLRGFRIALRRAEGERIFVETGDEDENHSTCG